MYRGTMNSSQDAADTSQSKIMAPDPAPMKQALVQKLQGAIQNLRRERDQEYREKVEAEERLRLAREELQALANIVADLKAKLQNLRQNKQTVDANLGPLAEQVNDLAEKVQFQHNELLSARAKIQQKTHEMDETSREYKENLYAIRQLAQERRLKTDVTDTSIQAETRHSRSSSEDDVSVKHQQQHKASWNLLVQKHDEGLERELNCLMFEWESFPKLMEEKARSYLQESKYLAEVNDKMVEELRRRGILVEMEDEETSTTTTQDGGESIKNDVTVRPITA